jgi:hypothetical protein
MFDINRDKENKFNFKINISGSTGLPTCRFVISLNDGYNLFFRGTIDKDSIVTVVIPVLSNIINFDKVVTTNASAQLEVIVDSSYFVPWESKISFKGSVSVTSVSLPSETSKIELNANLEGIIVEKSEPIELPRLEESESINEIEGNEVVDIESDNDIKELLSIKEATDIVEEPKKEKSISNREYAKSLILEAENFVEKKIDTQYKKIEKTEKIKERINESMILSKTYKLEDVLIQAGSKITIIQ